MECGLRRSGFILAGMDPRVRPEDDEVEERPTRGVIPAEQSESRDLLRGAAGFRRRCRWFW